jgi:hypothetical protein
VNDDVASDREEDQEQQETHDGSVEKSECGATVVLNIEDSTMTCSYRMFECIGMLSITFQAV